jgi:hypothetical protein
MPRLTLPIKLKPSKRWNSKPTKPPAPISIVKIIITKATPEKTTTQIIMKKLKRQTLVIVTTRRRTQARRSRKRL